MDKVFDRPLIPQVILIIAGFLIYGQVYNFGYNLDDEIVLQSQQFAWSWDGFLELIQSPYFSNSMGFGYGYRPVATLSFYLEYNLISESPTISHLINLIIYIGNVLLIFLIGCFILKNRFWAFTLAIIFLAHPIHVEVVASIKNRDELLAMFFGLLAFMTLRREDWWAMILTVILILLSLLSKRSGYGIMLLAPLAGLWLSGYSVSKFRILAIAMGFIAFYFFPDESVITKSLVLLSTLGFYYLSERFYGKYQQKFNRGLLAEILMVIGIVLCVYTPFSFDLLRLIFVVCVFVVAHWIRPSTGSLIVLIIGAVILSFLAKSWTVLVLTGIFVAYKPSNNSILQKGAWGFLLVVLFYHSIALGLYVVIGLAIVYALPLLFKSLANKWFLRINLLSMSVSLGLNLYALHKWAYAFLLLTFVTIYVLNFRNLLKPKLILGLTIIGISIMVLDPSVILNTEVIPDKNNIGVGVALTNSGRELNFIENPVSVETSLVNHFVAAVNTVGFYTEKIFMPINLAAYYGFDSIDVLNTGGALIWIIVFSTLIIGIWYYKLRRVLILLLLYLFSLLPFSNLVIPVAGIVGDRLMFIPSLMILLGVVMFLMRMAEKRSILIVSVLLICLAPMPVLAFQRTTSWKSKYTLYSNDVNNQPKSVKLNELMADWFYFESDLPDDKRLGNAFLYYQNGAGLYQEYDRNWYMMGKIKHQQGLYDTALSYYLKVKNLDYVDRDYYLNTGLCAVQVGNLAVADDYFKKAVSEPETSLAAYRQLVLLYLNAGNARLALSTGGVALENFPDDGWLNETQAKLYYELGDNANALMFLQKALELGREEPENMELLQRLNSEQ